MCKKLTNIIDQVSVAGAEYTITKFGKPKARLVPIKDTESVVSDYSQFSGQWTVKELKKIEANTTDFHKIDFDDWS